MTLFSGPSSTMTLFRENRSKSGWKGESLFEVEVEKVL
jgi:hypothetical protein